MPDVPPPAAAAAPPAAAAPNRKLFLANLGTFIVLALAATVWFTEHLQLYLTEIVVLGGAVTLWGALRLVWGLIEKLGQVDAAETSRRMLSTPEASLLLAVGTIVLLALWLTTGSLYFEHEGGSAGEREYIVQVTRKSDRTHFIDDISLSASKRVAGSPFFGLGSAVALDCTIVRPLRFEPIDCSVAPRTATKLRVPAQFKEKAFHLLRIVPGQDLFRELPRDTDEPVTKYLLEVEYEGRKHVVEDLRKRTLYAGGRGIEMALVRGLDDTPAGYQAQLVTQLRAAEVDEQNAGLMAAVLAASSTEWDALAARKGQRISFMLTRVRSENGQVERSAVEGFPMHYEITGDKVQTIWIPSR